MDIQDYIRAKGLEKYTRNTITDETLLIDELRKVRIDAEVLDGIETEQHRRERNQAQYPRREAGRQAYPFV